MPELILASASPRRHALIRLLGRPVTVRPADVDEESVTDPEPAVNVVRTARLKAEAAAAALDKAAIVIAADTTVALGGEMLNKPAGPSDARAMLRRLRGRTHQVHTGLVVLQAGTEHVATAVSTTDVTMRHYDDAEIDAYVASGDPLDKAGSYAIQHTGFRPVARLSGCYTGVVGFPLCCLVAALRKLNVSVDLPAATESGNYRECTICLQMLDGLLPTGVEP